MINKIKEKINKVPLTVKVIYFLCCLSILNKILIIYNTSLFTRLLTTEQYGKYTIYSSWSGMLMIFFDIKSCIWLFSNSNG